MAKGTVYEYPDAPSGAILIGNYKEPFMNTETGIGLLGVLAIDAELDKVQCSECGWWGDCLSLHIRHAHKDMNAALYKVKFGLSPKTALINEKMRTAKIKNGVYVANWMKKHPRIRRRSIRAFVKKGGRKGMKETMDKKNARGACPEQLLDAIVKLRDELGRRPSQRDFMKSKHARLNTSIVNTYGSWNEAIRLLGWDVMKKGQHFTYDSWTKAKIVDLLIIFMQKHGRAPSRSDCKRGLIPSVDSMSKYFGGLRNARAIAIKQGRFPFKIRDYESVNR